jgi:hypothetical protein
MLRPASRGLYVRRRANPNSTSLIWLCIVVESRVEPDSLASIRIYNPLNTAGAAFTIKPHFVTSGLDVLNGFQIAWFPISF